MPSKLQYNLLSAANKPSDAFARSFGMQVKLVSINAISHEISMRLIHSKCASFKVGEALYAFYNSTSLFYEGGVQFGELLLDNKSSDI